MAIFHTSIKTFSGRLPGAVLCLDLFTGQQHDFRRSSGVVKVSASPP